MTNPTPRNLSLDIFKGLGVIYMIIGHQIVWLFTYADGFGLLYPDSYHIFSFFRTGLHPLVLQLPVIAGASLLLWMNSKKIPFSIILQRSCLLLLLGFLLNYLSWGPMATLAWDVLPFVGLSTLISYPLIKTLAKKSSRIILFALAILCLSLSNRFPFADYQNFYIYKIFFGDIRGESYWPFCPWYTLFAVGIFLGQALNSDNKKTLKLLSGAGIILLTSYVLSEMIHLTPYFTKDYDYQNVWGSVLFKPSALFILGIIGFSLTFIPLVHHLCKKFPMMKQALANSFLITYAQGILWIYLTTVVFGYRITAFLKSIINPSYQQAIAMLPLLIATDLLLAYIIGRLIAFKKKTQYG